MPVNDADRPFGNAWLRFVGAARKDLTRLPARRPADQFIQFRDAVLREVESEDVATAVDDALRQLQGALFPNLTSPPPAGATPEQLAAAAHASARSARIAELLVKEWEAYAAAVDVAAMEQQATAGATGGAAVPPLTKLGTTALDSFRDIAQNLPPHVKALLKLLSEVFDLFA
jgi:hypothetical protein